MNVRQRAVAERGRPLRDPKVCLRRRVLAMALAVALAVVGTIVPGGAAYAFAAGAVLGVAAGAHQSQWFVAPFVRPPRVAARVERRDLARWRRIQRWGTWPRLAQRARWGVRDDWSLRVYRNARRSDPEIRA